MIILKVVKNKKLSIYIIIFLLLTIICLTLIILYLIYGNKQNTKLINLLNIIYNTKDELSQKLSEIKKELNQKIESKQINNKEYNQNYNYNIKKELSQKITSLEQIINNQTKKIKEINDYNKIIKLISKKTIAYKEFSQKIYEQYRELQDFFCHYENMLENKDFQNQLQIANVNFTSKCYNIYVYNNNVDAVSNSIINQKKWEENETLNILNALNYYRNKTRIINQDMYILDIGANIGWYSFYLGKYGYKIIAFEPNEKNYYILKKNYCLNKDVEIIIINKGLYNKEERKCNLYEHVGNIGNGLVICDKKVDIPEYLIKKGEIVLTQLSNYIQFLSDKKVIFMKIDAEGSEEAAILGGIQIITEQHVPFIFLEYCPNNLRMHNVDNRKFLELFEQNGYKISSTNFLDQKYVSIDELLERKDLINLYIVYPKVFE